uniref:Putative ovule protein n=1 Tax=Solanum chacoense TaxID=4108 RepID=A0A0V0GI47_SOLCH
MGFNGKSRRCLSWKKNPRIMKRMDYVLHVFHDSSSSPRGGRLVGSHEAQEEEDWWGHMKPKRRKIGGVT